MLEQNIISIYADLMVLSLLLLLLDLSIDVSSTILTPPAIITGQLEMSKMAGKKRLEITTIIIII